MLWEPYSKNYNLALIQNIESFLKFLLLKAVFTPQKPLSTR